RRERMTLGGDLDQARRTIAELQHSVDSTRAAARETELRLGMALETERQDAEARRAASAAELTRRVTLLEDDRIRLEAELSKERREGAEKQQALRSYVSTLREQYALACTERDAASREAELRRNQADDISRALDAAYAEFGRRLDEEHSEAVSVLSKVWDYVHNYPRLRDRPVP